MTNEVSVNLDKVIDKIADKVGLAVENVEPLAKETIYQFQQQELLATIFNGCLAVFFFLIIGGISVALGLKAHKIYRQDKTDDASATCGLGAGICGVVSVLSGSINLISFIDHLQAYLYPLPTLLGLN